jgi:hypothetical protein
LEKQRSFAPPQPPPVLCAGHSSSEELDYSRGCRDRRNFGAALDTPGSITSYSTARGVPAVRVVFCDAGAYDQLLKTEGYRWRGTDEGLGARLPFIPKVTVFRLRRGASYLLK